MGLSDLNNYLIVNQYLMIDNVQYVYNNLKNFKFQLHADILSVPNVSSEYTSVHIRKSDARYAVNQSQQYSKVSTTENNLLRLAYKLKPKSEITTQDSMTIDPSTAE